MNIVYNAFNGRYADSPRAIHEGLLARGDRHEHVWLQDPAFADLFPLGKTTVTIGTPAASAALEAADMVVNNTHVQLDRWRKRPGTAYLQTWHGTPLKRIHRSAVTVPGEDLMVELDADIARWDLLVSQSPAATVQLRSSFGYHGQVLETGYPRNDVLSSPDADERRRKLRAQLDIPDEATAVLYAPTYRDDEVDRPGMSGLDPAALLRRLGPGHVLLVRQHYFLHARPQLSGHPGLVDVSRYPEIADLYLAADVLVTDYSSAMFDFAVTGKPILVYAYDLQHYREHLRGFFFDLTSEGPGPVLLDQDALTEALLDLPGTVAATAERYAAFRARHCVLEDGHATDRVLDAVFAAGVPSRTD